MLTVQNMRHGGIMANYRCTAACRHCMYASSPDRTGGYITRSPDGGLSGAVAEKVCALLRKAGCYSVHIGGGEPFLDIDGMLTLVRILTDSGISVEYIETNAFWAADRAKAKKWLYDLSRAGGDTLCISLDPFHAEYVPIELTLVLAKTCQDVGFRYFLWQERFLRMMSGLDRSRTHSREEMEKKISPRYILDTARSYGIGYGGRAICIEAEYFPHMPADDVADAKPCGRLLSGGHFHIDMYGRFIPGCTGIAIPLEEAVRGVPDGKYPALEALLAGGSAALLRYARRLGFAPDAKGYPSGCALCFRIRHWLCQNAPAPELDPEHYRESLKFS